MQTQNVLSRYRSSFVNRMFLSARWYFTPYFKMASYLPTEGNILDLGCGHGLLATAAALSTSNRVVLGIDHDQQRVKIASEAAVGLENLSFREGDVTEIPKAEFSGMTLIDVMHYFPYEIQEKVFRAAFQRLRNGGTLLVREVVPGQGIASAINQLYEKIATLTGFTRTKDGALYFRSRSDWEDVLRSMGFQVKSEICSSRIFADVLYVCRKPTLE